jgi:2-oxoglutarate dehydrogenase E2 component (dihydrolipoamide succinyltransferase)
MGTSVGRQDPVQDRRTREVLKLIDIIVPAEQEGTKAVLKDWLKKPGDAVRKDEPIVEIETDKVAVEIASAADGVLADILVESGTDIEPGQVLGRISEGTKPETKQTTAGPDITSVAPQVVASKKEADQLPPGIRRLLAEHNLKPDDVPVRGERLTREDIEAEVARRASTPAVGVKAIPHDSMRKRIAEHMAHSMRVAPHVTSLFEADFSAISAHRGTHKAAFAKDGANLTFTAYFIAACVEAMKAVPLVNSRWYEDRVEIFEDVNIGIGTALGDKGLIVPVIHGAQTLSLLEIARQLSELTERARMGKLAPTDVQNGTFTISNHGVSGSLLASPIIINQPQSAILGIGKLQKRAMVREVDGRDVIEIRPMAYVTLTIDHRVLDAHQTNAWLSRFVETLEKWK